MKRIREKLSNNRGASLIFALLVFLLCAFAGAAALTAAASNAGRFTHAEHDQQNYLSVASAAELLREELEAPQLECTLVYKETYSWDNQGGEPTYSYELGTTSCKWSEDGEETDAELLLKTLMEAYCREVFEATIVPSEWYENMQDQNPEFMIPVLDDAYERTLTVEASEEAEGLDKNLEKVQATISLNPSTFALTIVLGAGEDRSALAYQTTILIPAETSSFIESKAETRGDQSGADKGETITTTTLTFTLGWANSEAIVIQNWEEQ